MLRTTAALFACIPLHAHASALYKVGPLQTLLPLLYLTVTEVMSVHILLVHTYTHTHIHWVSLTCHVYYEYTNVSRPKVPTNAPSLNSLSTCSENRIIGLVLFTSFERNLKFSLQAARELKLPTNEHTQSCV